MILEEKQIFMMSLNNYVKNFLKFFICTIIVFSLINAVNANEYKSVTRYVIDEKFGKTNLDKIRKISEIYKDGVIGDIIWRGTWNYLDSEGVV